MRKHSTLIYHQHNTLTGFLMIKHNTYILHLHANALTVIPPSRRSHIRILYLALWLSLSFYLSFRPITQPQESFTHCVSHSMLCRSDRIAFSRQRTFAYIHIYTLFHSITMHSQSSRSLEFVGPSQRSTHASCTHTQTFGRAPPQPHYITLGTFIRSMCSHSAANTLADQSIGADTHIR